MLVQYMLSSCVCLSVCLSHAGNCSKMAKCRIKQTVPHDSPGMGSLPTGDPSAGGAFDR